MSVENLGPVRELPFSVDFDGCLAESVWPDRGIGPRIERNVEKLGEIIVAGYEIAVHTARPWSDYNALQEWLVENEIPYNAIICGKFLAERYIDDKAINSEERSWL